MAVIREAKPLIGGIEMGGTKIICGVARDPWNVVDEVEIPTAAPSVSIAAVLGFFTRHIQGGQMLTSIGIGSFGPVDLVVGSSRYGELIDTPKSGWSGVNISRILAQELGIKCFVDTDVSCALMAEAVASRPRIKSAAYVTIGTGIGVSFMADGAIVRGETHSEFGHSYIPQHNDDSGFDGVCPFHANKCAEGLFSGPAIGARASRAAKEIPKDDQVWNIVSDYLGTFCLNLFYAMAPHTIILGGGVMSRRFLFPLIRKSFVSKLNKYTGALAGRVAAEDYIRPVALNGKAGLVGALMLAEGDAA